MLELAVFHPQSVAIAQRCKVQRIELCTDYHAGGLSPDMDFFSMARKQFAGALFVMIRPRPGNFVYQPDEKEWMQKAIIRFDKAGADGFVLGCLKENRVDAAALEMLRETAGEKPFTFHRAIDLVEDYEAGMETLSACGCARVLSSGKAASAIEGAEILACLAVKHAHSMIILAGGGIRSSNLAALLSQSSLKEFHSAAITNGGETADEEEVLRLMAAISARC